MKKLKKLSFLLFLCAALSSCEKIEVGEKYQGGIIFYVDQTGKHGLIASESDQSPGIMWHNGFNTTTNATGLDIGDGQDNTNSIVFYQGAGSYAAYLCDQLIIDGYDDWYLPSRAELIELYNKRNQVKNFTVDGLYWSSTEYNFSLAVMIGFSESYGAMEYFSNKSSTYRVRAIRKF